MKPCPFPLPLRVVEREVDGSVYIEGGSPSGRHLCFAVACTFAEACYIVEAIEALAEFRPSPQYRPAPSPAPRD